MSVSQDQPSNVNVSIRINSAGDNGPVVQVNSAGGGTTVEQVVEQRPSAPPRPQPVQPPRPPRSTPPDDSGGVPETWEWVWTSACFGDVARAAAAVPNWRWRWSCDEDAGPPSSGEGYVDVLPGMPDPGTVVGEVLASTPMAVRFVPSSASTRARVRRVKRSDHAASRTPRSAPAAVASAWGGGGSANAARLVVATASMPIAVVNRVREVVRTATQARPRRDRNPGEVPPPLGGATAIGTNALSAAASVLLGLWIAVLTTALVLVIPRLRRRRRSGPAWRLTRGTCSRLERPG